MKKVCVLKSITAEGKLGGTVRQTGLKGRGCLSEDLQGPIKVWSTQTRVEPGHRGRGGGAAGTWEAAVALPPHPTSRQDERTADQESWQEGRG